MQKYLPVLFRKHLLHLEQMLDLLPVQFRPHAVHFLGDFLERLRVGLGLEQLFLHLPAQLHAPGIEIDVVEAVLKIQFFDLAFDLDRQGGHLLFALFGGVHLAGRDDNGCGDSRKEHDQQRQCKPFHRLPPSDPFPDQFSDPSPDPSFNSF